MADTTNTAEIQVVVDASGVEAGLRQATGAAERAERQITGGANNSARSQGNLIAAIQRTTAQMESGGRAGSRYFEILAQQRGVDPRALEPYLRQLRAVEQAQTRAGQSAAQTSNAMRQLPAQMTDVLVSLQGGQSPLTVLLQQGGQVTDSFGGVGNAIRNVGSHILGLLNPVTLSVAAVAALGIAYKAGRAEANAYTLALATTGNTAGTTAALLSDAADQTARYTGSHREAAKVLASMVSTGQISSAAMVDLSVIAIKAQRDLGREVQTTVEEFASLGKDPVKALDDLAGKYRHITAEVYAHVKSLQDQGRFTEAATVAQQAHADGIERSRQKVLDGLSDWERGWKRIAEWTSKATDRAIDFALGISREKGPQAEINRLLDEREGIEQNIEVARARRDAYGERRQQALLAANEADINAQRRKLDIEKERGKEEARTARADALRREIANGADKLLEREEQRTRALAAARTRAAEAGLSEAETQKLLAITAREYKDLDEAAQKKREAAAKAAAEALKKEAGLLAELAGLTPGFSEDWDRLSKAYAKGALSLDQLTKAQSDLLAKQPGIKKANDDQIKAQAESDKLYEQGIKTAEQYRDSLLEQLGAQRQNNEVIGLSAEAAVDLQAQRLLDAAALKEQTAAALDAVEPGSRVAELYREQATALRDLASAKQEGARKQVAADSAKQAADDWKRASEEINRSLTDALLRGFESGKSFGRNLIDTLRNMFQTLVLRPIIQPMMAPMAGGLAGMMPGGAQASNGGSAISAFSGLSNFGGSTIAGIGNLLGSSSMSAFGAGFAGNTMGMATTAAETFASMGMAAEASAASFGAMASAAIPWIAGAAALFTIGKKAFGMGPKEVTGTTLNGSFGAGGFMGSVDSAWKKEGGWFRSDKTGVDKAAVDAAMSKQLTSAYDAIKAASAEFASVLGINADSIKDRAQSLSIALGKDEAANQKAIADFFVGVGNTIAGELLPSLSQFQQEGEQASATLQRLATGYSAIEQALWSVGMSFGAVGTASLEARERLLAAAGGLEAFAANTAGFQQNFLSEAERNAPVLKMVTEQLAGMGLSAVDTRDEFKAVVLGLDLTSEAGARQYGALMKLQAAFAQVYPSAEALAAALAEQEEAARRAAEAALQAAEAQARAAEEARQAAIQASIQAAKDNAANLLSGVDSMFSALQSVVTREKSLLEQSANAHRALSQALRGTLDSLSVAGNELEGRQSARAQIQAVLAIAKAGGVLPDADSLKGALSVLSKDASSMFATQQDYLRDFYSTQNDIAALAGLTDDALSVEEKSLKALDGILESAQQQINALKGIDYSVLTLAQAISGFQGALGAAKADPVASAGGSVANLYRELLGRSADSAGLDYWRNAVAGGMSLEQVRKMIMESSEYKGIPGFASGGMFGGGLRIVGENGPELEATGASRIWNSSQTAAFLSKAGSGDNGALVAEIKALRETVAKQQTALDKIVNNTGEHMEMFDKATGGGGPLQVEVVE